MDPAGAPLDMPFNDNNVCGGAKRDIVATRLIAPAAASSAEGSSISSSPSSSSQSHQDQQRLATQADFLAAISAPAAASRAVSELFDFQRPARRQPQLGGNGKLQLTPKQHDALYALAGCADVAQAASKVQHQVRGSWVDRRKTGRQEGRAGPRYPEQAPKRLPGPQLAASSASQPQAPGLMEESLTLPSSPAPLPACVVCPE